MNEVLIASLANRIQAGMMTIEQVPPVYREAVQERLDSKSGDDELENSFPGEPSEPIEQEESESE